MISFTPSEMQRYSRQMMLDTIGVTGQQKLKAAKVLCVGAGGLGSPLLLYLAAAGVGTLGIIDHDVVDLSNLQRQILFQDTHLDTAKVVVAKEQIAKTNPHVEVITYHKKLDATNAADILAYYDVIADCSDNFATRYLINDFCLQLQKPFIAASVSQFSGQCTLFTGQTGPCFRCLFPYPPKSEFCQSCADAGVLNVVPGLLGILQATEIIKWIVEIGDVLIGRIIHVDLLTMRFREFVLPKNPDCHYCSQYDKRTYNYKINAPTKTITMNQYLIAPAELKELFDAKQDIQLIDVRTQEKHNAFNIGGVLIPSEELPQRIHELDRNKLIVTYCTTGGRSMRALQFLISSGFTHVKSLDGGMTRWQEKL